MPVHLQIDHVSVQFGAAVAVDDVSVDLPPGEVLAVLGPSGCGKSTLLRAVAGLEPLTAGRILADGADLAKVPTHRRGFALMFQDGQLFEHLSVGGNVAYPWRIRGRRGPETAQRVAELLDLVGLAGYADRSPSTLSGGERQRVALARALAVEPRLLLLDEPLSALDRSLRERLAVDLRSILTSAGTTALLVTHDHEEAFAIADRMAVMRAGRVVQSGTLDEVWNAPVDADTARFLGYADVLDADRSATLARLTGLSGYAGGELAMRRSALRVRDEGPVSGVVRRAALFPEQVRLSVDVDGLGTLDAVAPAGPSAPGVGDRVRMVIDATRVADVGTLVSRTSRPVP